MTTNKPTKPPRATPTACAPYEDDLFNYDKFSGSHFTDIESNPKILNSDPAPQHSIQGYYAQEHRLEGLIVVICASFRLLFLLVALFGPGGQSAPIQAGSPPAPMQRVRISDGSVKQFAGRTVNVIVEGVEREGCLLVLEKG